MTEHNKKHIPELKAFGKEYRMIISVTTLKELWPNYFLAYVDSMCHYFSKVLIISTTYVSDIIKDGFPDNVFVLEAIEGDDFDHWIYGLNNTVQSDRISNEVVFFSNDTIYGPLHDISSLLNEMITSESEYCGLTNQLFSLNNKKNVFIHTYFFSLKNSALSLFRDGLSNNETDMTKEMYLSYFLVSQNIKCSVLFDIAGELNNDGLPEPCILSRPLTVLEKFGTPFLPRYLFSMPSDELQLFSDGYERYRLFDYLKDKYDYPLHYIVEDGLNQLNIYDFINRYGMTHIVSECSYDMVPSKCAVIIYLFYLDQISEYFKWIDIIPNGIDLYILSQSKEVLDSFQSNYESSERITYIYISTKGREWGALLHGLKNKIEQYDYACFMHDKSFHEFEFPGQGVSFRNMLWNNLLPSSNGIIDIVNYLFHNPYVGLLVPPVVKVGSYFKYFGNFWIDNFDNAKQLLSDLDCSTGYICKEKPPVSIGGMFWFRPNALKELFQNTDKLVFPDEPLGLDGTVNHALERVLPYIAQANGYATSYVITKDYLSKEWLLDNEMMQSMNSYNQFVGNTYYDQLRQ